MASRLWQRTACIAVAALAALLADRSVEAAALTTATTAKANLTTTIAPSTTTLSTTLPPDPTNMLYIAIPVGILLGVPLIIAAVMCFFGLSAAVKKTAHNAQHNRVTPIQDTDYSDVTTPVERVNIPVADDPFAYGYGGDASYQEDELERRPRYAQDWNY